MPNRKSMNISKVLFILSGDDAMKKEDRFFCKSL